MDKQILYLEVDGCKGKERPCKTKSVTITEDLKAQNIDVNNVHDVH